ncbi:MAG: hypothetical protein IAE79_05180 [Anaerolinea sp.]|nr:hypothetical protein [Anaerolinea sp.]
MGLAGALFTKLGETAVPPLNYAIGLALFQAFVIPAIICYGFARKTVPADVEQMRQTLRRYAETAVTHQRLLLTNYPQLAAPRSRRRPAPCSPTSGVARWWAGRDNTALTEPASSHETCLKTRQLPPVGCMLY